MQTAEILLTLLLFAVVNYYPITEVIILHPDKQGKLLERKIYKKYKDGELSLFSVADYYKREEVGIWRPDDRVELIAGQIIKIALKEQRLLHQSEVRVLLRCYAH